MHYYPFHIAEYNLHTSHLTIEEDAVYRRLIDYYYDKELPIPKETQPVIRRLRLGSYDSQVEQILSEFFTLESDGWHNYRCDIEINKYHSNAEKARLNGRKGGRPPKNKGLKTQPVILANPDITQTKAKQELEPVTRTKNNINNSSPSGDCPHGEIINIYHDELPSLRKVKVWNDQRKKLLRTRWRESEKHQSIEFWKGLFNYVGKSQFLMGNVNNFQVDLEWIIKPSNFIKIVEGKYHE